MRGGQKYTPKPFRHRRRECVEVKTSVLFCAILGVALYLKIILHIPPVLPSNLKQTICYLAKAAYFTNLHQLSKHIFVVYGGLL